MISKKTSHAIVDRGSPWVPPLPGWNGLSSGLLDEPYGFFRVPKGELIV